MEISVLEGIALHRRYGLHRRGGIASSAEGIHHWSSSLYRRRASLHRRRVFIIGGHRIIGVIGHHWRASHHRRHRSSLEDQHWSHHVISGFSIGGSALEDQHWSHRVIGGINSIIIRADPRKIEAEELVEHKRAT